MARPTLWTVGSAPRIPTCRAGWPDILPAMIIDCHAHFEPRMLDVDELDRFRQVKGMIGVKLHPHWHDYRTEILSPLLRRCEELKLPVLIHRMMRVASYR